MSTVYNRGCCEKWSRIDVGDGEWTAGHAVDDDCDEVVPAANETGCSIV